MHKSSASYQYVLSSYWLADSLLGEYHINIDVSLIRVLNRNKLAFHRYYRNINVSISTQNFLSYFSEKTQHARYINVCHEYLWYIWFDIIKLFLRLLYRYKGRQVPIPCTSQPALVMCIHLYVGLQLWVILLDAHMSKLAVVFTMLIYTNELDT